MGFTLSLHLLTESTIHIIHIRSSAAVSHIVCRRKPHLHWRLCCVTQPSKLDLPFHFLYLQPHRSNLLAGAPEADRVSAGVANDRDVSPVLGQLHLLLVDAY